MAEGGVTVAVKVTGLPWDVALVDDKTEVVVTTDVSAQAEASTLASTEPKPVTRL